MSQQRETYTLPSPSGVSSQSHQQSQPSSSTTTTTTTTAQNAFAFGTSAGDDSMGPVTQYICGECAHKVRLRKGDVIRCTACGHRVLYKERTKRMVQFEAR